MSSIELAAKYDIPVPRYTSYPTAPHFSAAIGAQQYADWLRALPVETPLSIYIHIPFCDELCWFCGCYTKIVHRYEPIASYLASLHQEIALIAECLPGRHAVQHLHFGGGSPTMLAPDDWQELIRDLKHRFEFRADAEIAVEIDPRETTEAYVAALAETGVTRASIGVQDFDADVQKAINRLQPFSTVAQVIDWLRRHGITSINLDLMYGLPLQTEQKLRATLSQALALEPDRVALFGYAHVPWMKAHQRLIDAATLPDAAARHEQLDAATGMLMAAGYRRIGFDHFARPTDDLAKALDGGRLRRNFQGYTPDNSAALIGLGASAIGSLPQGYVQNVSPLADYRRQIAAGELAIVRGLALSPEDRLRRDVIERLMCTMQVDLAQTCRDHGTDPSLFDAERAALRPMVADGLVALDGDRIIVTYSGQSLVRAIAAVFDAYLSLGKARHSRAV